MIENSMHSQSLKRDRGVFSPIKHFISMQRFTSNFIVEIRNALERTFWIIDTTSGTNEIQFKQNHNYKPCMTAQSKMYIIVTKVTN